jgi:protein-L-isoaspartate O-methyltransferase
MRLPRDLSGLSLLDVGCNEGYFCQEAWRRGAMHVVGMDRNSKFIDQARERDSRTDYRIMDFAEVPSLNERFDVILLLSALHYAADPEQLLCDLMRLLTSEGLLILECGVAPGTEARWVSVERVDDVVRHPTYPMLLRSLNQASVRRLGVSVEQPGDPVPRQVFHVRRLRPIVFLVSGASGSGKTTLLETMNRTASIVPINLDYLLVTLPEWTESEALLRLMSSRAFAADRLYELIDAMAGECVEEEFVDELIARHTRIASGEGTAITMIEGYALSRGKFAAVFTERLRGLGCYVWNVEPAAGPPEATVKPSEEQAGG